MVRRTVEIRVVTRHGSAGAGTLISVELPGGETRTFSSLQEMPDDLRALAEPLFCPASVRSLRKRFLKQPRPRSSSSDRGGPTKNVWMPERRGAEPSMPGQRAGRRQDREIMHMWFDLWAAGGGLAMAVFPLALARSAIFGGDPWTLWTWSALLLSACGLYLMLAFLINFTRLTADETGLSVQHGPLPWYGNRFIPRDHLRQLFVRVRSSNRLTEYALCARTTFGTCELAGSLHDPDALRRYEQELEEYFGIEDRPVRGNQYR